MSIWESVISALFCMSMVFVVLIFLYFLIKLFSFAIRTFEGGSMKNQNDPNK
jgi:Na+-transporting methylmalonyl-CoA/oxaloacetate decarboxylase gamma subunit